MNQIEIWFSILVRKVPKRGNFTTVDELKRKVLAFIEYYNRTMAKPFINEFTRGGLLPPNFITIYANLYYC